MDLDSLIVKEPPRKVIEIVMHGIEPEDIDNVSVYFRDKRAVETTTERSLDGNTYTIKEVPVCQNCAVDKLKREVCEDD